MPCELQTYTGESKTYITRLIKSGKVLSAYRSLARGAIYHLLAITYGRSIFRLLVLEQKLALNSRVVRHYLCHTGTNLRPWLHAAHLIQETNYLPIITNAILT